MENAPFSCIVVLDRDEGFTRKTKNKGEKQNLAIFLDSMLLLEVFLGKNQEI